MPVNRLYIANVGPFEEIEFEFDPQVNVFTGPNNSGKSTALWVLGDAAVFPFSFPEKLLRSEGTAKFKICIPTDPEGEFEGQLPCRLIANDTLGDVHPFWNKERTEKHIALLEQLGYSKFIPALRRSTDFRSAGPTATQRQGASEGREFHPNDSDAGWQRFRRRAQGFKYLQIEAEGTQEPELKKRIGLTSDDPNLVSDEAVIQKIIELDYRSYLRRNDVFREIVTKIGTIASEITTGFPIEFIGVDEDTNGFFPQFETVDGTLPINTLSQGTQSIIQWLAHLLIGYAEYYDFPKNLEQKPGVLIIDEIDAHLHPSWQQRIIPTLVGHFPNLQIFCSTHSPLMLAGLRKGQIQLLQRDENGRVTVTRNEVEIAGWTADEILRNFLGVVDPTDLESAERLARLQFLRNLEVLSSAETEELEKLRYAVSLDLLNSPVSTQLQQIAEAINRREGGANE